ncbi:MAG: hypothetical protein EA357_01495 [Micavibrio sp.]|nr:MAG: hypothetical protein EA357_01495 [Micavibrio sp.]
MTEIAGISGAIPQTSARSNVQPLPAPESQTRSATENFISSRIRIDNLLDLAILEFRSHETGEVLRQFPTERQIEAFQRAAQLETRQEQQREVLSGSINETGQTAPQNSQVNPTPAPEQINTGTSSPSSAPVASSSADGGTAGLVSSPVAQQSVVV